MTVKSDRLILHLDLDSFYVSVERLRDPTLNGKPVIVGGTGSRGVVASCSYEARSFGVRSAMPVTMARKLCPDGLFVRGNMEEYSRFSSMVTKIISEAAPEFEKTSIDEFYVDMTGMERFFGSEKWAMELRNRIKKETGLPISTGLSINKTVAKIATGEAKPDGYLYVPKENVEAFLSPLAIEKMPGAGEAACKIFHGMGIRTIGDLAALSKKDLERKFGVHGSSLWRKAKGEDDSEILPYGEAKSLSTETTFHRDTNDLTYLNTILLGMVEQLGYRMRKNEQKAGCVSIKVRYSDFKTVSMQATLADTDRDDLLAEAVLSLFRKFYKGNGLIRLLGVRFSKLSHAALQLGLFENSEAKAKLMTAMDEIRNKYGSNAVGRARPMVLDGDEDAMKERGERPLTEKPITSFIRK